MANDCNEDVFPDSIQRGTSGVHLFWWRHKDCEWGDWSNGKNWKIYDSKWHTQQGNKDWHLKAILPCDKITRRPEDFFCCQLLCQPAFLGHCVADEGRYNQLRRLWRGNKRSDEEMLGAEWIPAVSSHFSGGEIPLRPQVGQLETSQGFVVLVLGRPYGVMHASSLSSCRIPPPRPPDPRPPWKDLITWWVVHCHVQCHMMWWWGAHTAFTPMNFVAGIPSTISCVSRRCVTLFDLLLALDRGTGEKYLVGPYCIFLWKPTAMNSIHFEMWANIDLVNTVRLFRWHPSTLRCFSFPAGHRTFPEFILPLLRLRSLKKLFAQPGWRRSRLKASRISSPNPPSSRIWRSRRIGRKSSRTSLKVFTAKFRRKKKLRMVLSSDDYFGQVQYYSCRCCLVAKFFSVMFLGAQLYVDKSC